MADERVPVLIVGAGLAGASTAMFLGLHGVRPLLVERHPSTSNQPKARGQMWHTMEALRMAGVAERVRAAGYDINLGMPIVIAESVAGRRYHEILGEKWPDMSHLTPEQVAMASQERTEPILVDRARELGAEIRFRTRLEMLSQDSAGVHAVLRDLTTGATSTVTADYLVAADGWRGAIRNAVGIGTHGRGDLNHSVYVVFDADLAAVVEGREFALFYLQNPALSRDGGTFVSTDTPGRWVLNFSYDPAEEDWSGDIAPERLLEKIRVGVGIPDLDATIVHAATSGFAHRLADRYRAGRVFLAGDAAHTMPPHGGQGGNTALLDGFFLAWRLAAVVQGWAGPGLLDTYDAERRPYGEMIANQQYRNMVERTAPHQADGTEDAPVPAEQALLGYRCVSDAVVLEPDDDGALLEDPAAVTGRPGSRAPHVWLERAGKRISTIDLYGRGFVLLTASPTWASTANEVARRLGVPLRAELVNVPSGLSDVDGQVPARYGIGVRGASLIRPDGFVAWRTTEPASPADLEKALRTVLHR